MKVPFSWLKEFVDIDVTAQELTEKLFSCGFEVEELTYMGAEIDRCVVGRIEKMEKHPDADKLKICHLNCGEYGSDIQIVTGANNVEPGDLVPVALDGSSLHNGVKIKKGKLRGIESNGMLCSGEELGITDDWYEGAEVNGILLLRGDVALGTDIKEVVGLEDYLFDISVTANRPDCQSVYGIAREVAAVLKKPLEPLELTYAIGAFSTGDRVRVTVEAPDLCPRYIAHYVRNLKVEKSPQWMRRRLALCGLRSINNVVDITNYVLLELGQPMHAFDLAKVERSSICVRRAGDGEKITTLDEKEFTLNHENLVIADGAAPVALAGVMGGLNSGISESTAELLFESAKFERANIRRTSRKLGQKSDSSARFEKGVDAYTTGVAINRALNLIDTLACGEIARDRFDIGDAVAVPKVIHTSVGQINGLLGITVPKEEICAILDRLNFSVTANGDALTVTVPAYREDVDGYPDLAEEVIRMYGYDHIEGTFMESATVTNGGLNAEQQAEEKIRQTMSAQGCSEMISYSFISPKDYELLRMEDEIAKALKIKNPIGEDLSLMRTTSAPSMLNTLIRNVRRTNEAARLYELASVYLAKSLPLEEQPEEHTMLSIGIYGPTEDFFTAKGVFEALAAQAGVTFEYVAAQRPFLHPGKCAEILLDGKTVGYLGELSPEIAANLSVDVSLYLGELDYASVAHVLAERKKYMPLPKFAEVVRDIALVAEEGMTCAEIEKVIKASCKFLTSVRLFDVYRGSQVGEGKKSMAFSVTFTPRDKAITNEDADGFVKKILKSLHEKLNIELR